jgi:hypothetical protein
MRINPVTPVKHPGRSKLPFISLSGLYPSIGGITVQLNPANTRQAIQFAQ